MYHSLIYIIFWFISYFDLYHTLICIIFWFISHSYLNHTLTYILICIIFWLISHFDLYHTLKYISICIILCLVLWFISYFDLHLTLIFIILWFVSQFDLYRTCSVTVATMTTYNNETSCVILKVEHSLGVIKNKVLWRTWEVTPRPIKRHNNELCDMNPPQHVFTRFKLNIK